MTLFSGFCVWKIEIITLGPVIEYGPYCMSTNFRTYLITKNNYFGIAFFKTFDIYVHSILPDCYYFIFSKIATYKSIPKILLENPFLGILNELFLTHLVKLKHQSLYQNISNLA